MEISIREFKNAKKGDILVYDGKFWQPQKSEDLIKSLKKRIDDLEKLNEGMAEKERIRQEEERAKFRSHSCLIASLLIENKIAKGELDEPGGYDVFISMVEDFQKGGAWTWFETTPTKEQINNEINRLISIGCSFFTMDEYSIYDLINENFEL